MDMNVAGPPMENSLPSNFPEKNRGAGGGVGIHALVTNGSLHFIEVLSHRPATNGVSIELSRSGASNAPDSTRSKGPLDGICSTLPPQFISTNVEAIFEMSYNGRKQRERMYLQS